LSAKEVKDGVYNWISGSNGASDPTIKAFVNNKNVIEIHNPTDTKHELIIDTGADVLPSSDDIAPNRSGQLTFSPGVTGTFTYHCAYHPFTMKGTIQIDLSNNLINIIVIYHKNLYLRIVKISREEIYQKNRNTIKTINYKNANSLSRRQLPMTYCS
jgi:hypothetical protein